MSRRPRKQGPPPIGSPSKGPYEVRDLDDLLLIMGEDGKYVAEIQFAERQPAGKERTPRECRGNAYLLAASWEMYAALRTLVDDIERWESAVATVIGRVPGHGMRLEDAHRALRSAAGEYR